MHIGKSVSKNDMDILELDLLSVLFVSPFVGFILLCSALFGWLSSDRAPRPNRLG